VCCGEVNAERLADREFLVQLKTAAMAHHGGMRKKVKIH
jgi:hypothetical protein